MFCFNLGRHRGKKHLAQKFRSGVDGGQTMSDSFKRIGGQLQAARKDRGLRKSDVARELRISAEYLRWLESGDFDQLPAPAYVSGFLRSYGKFLGLDGANLADRFYAIQGDAASKIDYTLPVTAGPPQRSAPAVASLFVVLALISYGGWYWISGPTTPDATAESELAVFEIENKQPGLMEKTAIGQSLENASQTTSRGMPVDQDAPNIISTDDGAKKISSGITLGAGVSTGAGTIGLNEADHADRTIVYTSAANSDEAVKKNATEETVSLDIATVASSSSPMINNDVETQPVTKLERNGTVKDAAVMPDPVQQLVPGGASAVATSRDPDQEVTIRAIASSWVEIVRGDGTAVLKKLMKAGETYIVDDGSSLYLSTGNAGGIELVTVDNDIITVGTIGEIVRDLPLSKNRLRERF